MLRRRGERTPLNAEINVVSLIDVMMLLMVIFMITAPMMQGGLDVNLPVARSEPLDPKSGLVVTVTKNGRIAVDRTEMSLGEFRGAFAALAGSRARDGVFLQGDAAASYGLVMRVLSIIRAAGTTNVGLVTQPEER